MKRQVFLGVFLALVLIGAGCASKPAWKSEPNTRQVENQFFNAAISPVFIFDGYKGFLLTIHNKTSKNMEIDWNKTLYIYNSKTNGGFMFKDTPFADRNKPRPAEIIPGDALFQKEIFPSNLAEFSSLGKGTPT